MSPAPTAWVGTITIGPASPLLLRSLGRALEPELAREVARAGTRLGPPRPGTLELAIHASDTGALRAALNTYLGWIDLVVGTVRAVGTPDRAPAGRP